MGAISNMLRISFEFTVPEYREGDCKKMIPKHSKQNKISIILATAQFVVAEKQIKGNIIIFLKVGSLETLLSLL